jgi:hypothetical protein
LILVAAALVARRSREIDDNSGGEEPEELLAFYHPKTLREVLQAEKLPDPGRNGKSPVFPSKNAPNENRRKFLRRNGQRGYSGIHPEY